MSSTITVSAPGKLMLMGEHAVVYNHPCLVTAVDQRIRAKLTRTKDTQLVLNAPDVQIENYSHALDQLGSGEVPKGAKFVEWAVKNFRDRYPFTFGLKIETASEFSSQFGFGSSSASTVCVVKALAHLTDRKLDNKTIFEIAYKTVLDVQGKGSGFDIAAAVYGGTLYFVTAGGVIEPLSIDAIPLTVGYSGVKADTVALMNQVKTRSARVPGLIEDAYVQIERLVEMGKTAIMNHDLKTFGLLMDMNQGYLEMMGVSIAKLCAMIYAARDAGAYGAKLSGAGGGDCMICLADESKQQLVQSAITDAGGEVINIKTHAEGARVEN